MADREDVRRITAALPETCGEDGCGVRTRGKERGFAWVWKERLDPKKPRVPNPAVLAIRTANLEEKEALLASDPDKFFTEPHYHGYPAVLVRLASVELDELGELLTDGWRCMAPKALVAAFDARREANT